MNELYIKFEFQFKGSIYWGKLYFENNTDWSFKSKFELLGIKYKCNVDLITKSISFIDIPTFKKRFDYLLPKEEQGKKYELKTLKIEKDALMHIGSFKDILYHGKINPHWKKEIKK